MQLQLIIKGTLVEAVDVPIDHVNHPTYKQRASKVNDYVQYFKRKYAIDIMITNDWVIELVTSSAINYEMEDSQEKAA